MSLVHPIMFALLPILFLYSRNADEVPFTDTLLPAALFLGAAVLLYAVLRLALKDGEASGIIVSAALVLVSTFGRLVEAFGGSAAVLVVVSVLYSAAFVAVSFLAFRKRGKLGRSTQIITVVAITLVAFSAFSVVSGHLGKNPGAEPRDNDVAKAAASKPAANTDPGSLPDIYYIILDGYASESTLRDYYAFDNSAFIENLTRKGFYVAPGSHGNYTQTRLSLASSLNLEYINDISGKPSKGSTRTRTLNDMIEDNGLVRFLKSRGYGFAFFGSNWSGTLANRNADLSVTEQGLFDTEFMVALLKTTAFRGLVSASEGLFTRQGVLNIFSRVPEAGGGFDKPVFVFAHIVPPHRPFMFDRDGNPVSAGGANDWGSKDLYIDQLVFVNTKVEEMVGAILANSEKPPVIIVQADHGPMPPGGSRTLIEPTEDDIRIRTGILNAYYVPGMEGSLYESITPVNSFRLVLNALFGTRFEVLEDRVYFSSYSDPYTFRDVTGIVTTPVPPDAGPESRGPAE